MKNEDEIWQKGFEEGRKRTRHIHDILEIRLNEIIDNLEQEVTKQASDLLEMGGALRKLQQKNKDLKEEASKLRNKNE